MVEGWQRKSVGSIFEVQLGKMLNRTAKEKWPQYPYLTNLNVRWGAFDVSQLNTMFFSEGEKRKFELRPGDILVCEGGEIGRCAVWDGSLTPCYYQKALHRLRPKGPILPKYFQSYMEYVSGTKVLTDLVSRTSIAHLTREKLTELPVLLPPLAEQRRIAEILQTWDEAIEKSEALRVIKAKKLEHLSWRLIHGDNYQEVRLQDMLTRGVSIEKGVALTREKTLSGPYAVIGGGQSSSYSHCRYTHKPPCITVSASGAYAGFVRRHRESIWASDCNVLTTNSFSLDYIYFALKTQQKKLYSLQSGGAQPHIYSKDILSLKIPLPSDEMQGKIAAFLNAATEEVVLLNQQAITLTRQKRGLMQKLLTGEWRAAV